VTAFAVAIGEEDQQRAEQARGDGGYVRGKIVSQI